MNTNEGNASQGRGANSNLAGRFESLSFEKDEDASADEDTGRLRTSFLYDDSQSILSKIDSEDLSFEYGLNPYRGCEHGCSYCYARTYHEYLGFSAGLDFESQIVVKKDAPALLEKALSRPGYRVGKIAMSGVTDCYQPVERRLAVTRGCLEVMARYRQPVGVITKNALIARDLDHLTDLARWNAVAVYVSVTTLDPKLARILEPRASTPRARLETLAKLSEAGVPCGVSAAPMIPGLNDSELPAIVEAAANSGASFAFFTPVRLPGAVKQVFEGWLDRHFPLRKDKIMGRIRVTHGGAVNTSTPRERMRGKGEPAGQLRALFRAACRKHGLSHGSPELSCKNFRRLTPGQDELF